MTLVLGAFTIGMILALLAMGVWISFRILRYCDITVDGSITLGASVAAVLLLHGQSPLIATIAATLAGASAGCITGILHTRFRIQELLSGILVMTALYSINLRIMGRSNIPLLDTADISSPAQNLIQTFTGGTERILVLGWLTPVKELAMLLSIGLIVLAVGALIHWFLRTDLGMALRAAGENPQMARAQGINHHLMIIFGLALSNGMVGMAGALLAQYQGFADIQMGIGMIVWGLASIIIGEALVRKSSPGYALIGAVMGTILFRLLIAIALRWGLNPNDLKLVTAAFVLGALVLPAGISGLRKSLSKGGCRA